MNRLSRIWAWLSKRGVTILVIIALVLSFVIGQHEASQNAQSARLDNVAGCVRSNANSALFSALVRISVESARAQARAERSPRAAAQVDRFRSFASGGAHYLAIASFIQNPERATRTRRVPLGDGESITVLTRPAEALILKGCVMTFHAEDDPVEKLPAVGVQTPN